MSRIAKRRRGGPNINQITSMEETIKVGAINVGGKKGWRKGAELLRQLEELDLLFFLDVRGRSTERPHSNNLAAETYDTIGGNSSMICTAKEPKNSTI